ncbi:MULTISPECIES: MFS transporter [unclassified Acidocella]|uniref:MFS transporter n=1 Tax=unclassified Acidocella TaxID=2648610 RepID=UPI00028D4E59|nr:MULTISPECIES: MFS transporter [unclassified Acidocella]EKM98326.1 major facilitator transporter [Acidocella sp. MX-AZ02]WBO59298.1 MFS transporter [Acidocella sp. MX-AZ03]
MDLDPARSEAGAASLNVGQRAPARNPDQRASRIRWGVATFMWFAIAINYIDRTVLAAAAPTLIKTLSIPVDMMGIVLSAFFWSYALMQMPAGWFSDKFGQKKGLGFAVLLWSVATSATSMVSGFASLFAMRLGLGIGEAGAYPSNAGITAKWFPLRERATIAGLFDSASKFGGAVAMPLIVWLIAAYGWRMTFLIIGAMGVVWSIAWFGFFRETPEQHPGVNAAELAYIREGQAQHATEGKAPLPWYALLRHRNVWAMCLGFFTINYISYFFITWLPTYLVKQEHMTMLKMGFVAMLPLLVGMLIEVAAGWASDRALESGRYSLTAVRKFFLIFGLVLAMSIGLAPLTHNVVAIVALLCLAKAGTTISASQVWALPADVAPRSMTSTLAGLQNMVSNFGGVVGPIVTGFIVASTGSFNAALFASALIGLVGILIYAFLLGKVKPIAV